MKMNLPNKLTITRIALIPVMMFFYLATFIPYGYGKIVALALFIVASVTDFLDGYIARKYNIVTDFGKFADSIADKMLTFSALFMFMVDGTIPAPYGVIFAVICLVRDLIVLGIKSLVASKGNVVGAEKIGKIKFFISTIAYPLGFLVAVLNAFAVSGVALLVFQILFYVLIGTTAILTVYSGICYLVKYKYVFDEI